MNIHVCFPTKINTHIMYTSMDLDIDASLTTYTCAVLRHTGKYRLFECNIRYYLQ